MQVALALILLISSAFIIRTFQAMRRVQPGFTNPASIQTFRVFIPEAQVREPQRVVHIFEEMDHKLAAISGINSAGISTSITMDGNHDQDPVFVQDHPETERTAPILRQYKMIAPGYFHTMGNPLLAGRDLSWEDIDQARPVVIISENLARLYWPTPQAVLGKRIRESPQGTWGIIGVYGVVSYAVSQRTREIRIRIALSASRQAVRGMFVGQALLLVAIGILAGVATASALTRAMQAPLFETSPLDPLTYCAISIVITAAAFVASYFPARRASAVDPAHASRVE